MLKFSQESMKGPKSERNFYSTRDAEDLQWCERNADLVQCGGTKVVEFVAFYGYLSF